MKIISDVVSAYDYSHHILKIEADKGETIRVGQKISIMILDEDTMERIEEHEIASMHKWVLQPDEKHGDWIDVESVSNGEDCKVEIYGIDGRVQTADMPSPAEQRAELERLAAMINVTPYKEINHGVGESIYDHIDENFTVPEKVILYLQTTQPHFLPLGLYKHPFKDMKLCGPYSYTDGEYYWDRDTWKYIVKYHVTIPQNFIDKVMSDEGTAFLEKYAENNEEWRKRIKELKENPETLYLVPKKPGDYSLDEF